VILADDLGATDLGCFGSTFYETPHLDRLAASGMRLTVAYSACPVCSPTRASMLTGRYPQRTGITDFISPGGSHQPQNWNRDTRLLPAPNADQLALGESTIAEVLRNAGYATFFAGKWHLGGTGFLPSDQGFDVNRGGYQAGSPRSYFSPYRNPNLPDGPPGEELSLRLADETCQFIEANRNRPFFAYVALYAVHIPLQARRELIEKYEAKAAKLEVSATPWGRERDRKVRLIHSHPTYAAMIESMDTAVGKVLEKLDDLKLTENTIVIFTSDNGGVATSEGWPTANRPLRAGKGWAYEGGIRVPTIIRWPSITAPGSTCGLPVISNDYYPTLLEAANLAANSRVDGISLVPLLRGEQVKRGPLFWDYPHYSNQGSPPVAAVRDGRWKLIKWHEDNSTELYDLENDPGENRDLALKHPEIVARLRKKLVSWRKDVGAKAATPNPRYQAASERSRKPGAKTAP
jgi:arylsulfatase A-like enzyme